MVRAVSRWMRWGSCVARMGETRNFGRKREWKKPLGIPSSAWEDNIRNVK